MGIGMVVIVEKDQASELVSHFNELGETASIIGVVTENEGITIV